MKRFLGFFCLGLLAVLMSATAFAQGKRTSTGVVLSAEDNEPIIGASVAVKGTTMGVITDFDGNFELKDIPSDAKTLVVSFVGMKTQEVAIANRVKVVLESAMEVLEDVVVTGMAKVDKRMFTGATTKLNSDDMKIAGVADVSRSLEGRAAGVSVQNVSGTFGTAPKIRVRGATSIYGSSKPLWVVDGTIMEDVVEVSADDLSSGDAETLISSAIAGLNSDDIESFQILKDGSATSIYGARAMAGVIVITTKKGKAGSNRISYTGEYSMRLKPSYRNFNIMNSQEQMSVYREMEKAGWLNMAETYRASNSGVYGKMYRLITTYDEATGQFALANTEAARNQYLREAEYRNTDWFDQLFTNSVQHNHSISLSSGTDKAQYYASFSLMNDPGWYKKSKIERYTANINANYNISKKLTLNLIGNASYRKQQAPGTLGSDIDVVNGEVRRDFDINPYSYSMNTSRTLAADQFYYRNYAPFNILHELDNNYMDLDVVDTRFQAEIQYKPIQKLTLSLFASYKYSTTTQAHYIKDGSNQAMAYRAMDDATMRDNNPWLYNDPDVENSLKESVLPYGGFYRQTNNKMNNWETRATFQYIDMFDDTHIVNIFGGMETSSVDRNRTFFTGTGMQYDMGMLAKYDYRYFKQSQEENTPYFTINDKDKLSVPFTRSAAFFANANYSYKSRYNLNGTVRYEGTNKLGKSRSARWLPTWNVSGSWNAHEEEWFHDVFEDVLSNFTLKGSYSLTGDRGPTNVTNSQVVIQSYNPWRPFTSVGESGLEIDDIENSELTYEKKHELNIGAEIGFINNRINLEFDWYKRNNYDLIGTINTMGIGGQITKYANVASMKSHGVEFTLSTKNIAHKNFKWNTDFIFSFAENEVTDLDTNARIIDMITGSGFTLEGYPVRSLFSIDFQGLNDEGLPTFINEYGEKTVSTFNFQDREHRDYLVYEGPTDPTVTGSFGNLFKYKGISLNVYITYSFGNVVRLDPVFSNSYTDLDALPKEFVNRWTRSGDEAYTNIPVLADKRMDENDSYLSRAYNAYNYSTARIAKGDFIRMKEISLGYDFPKNIVNSLSLNNLSLKLQATNLFLIYADKKLNGQDPEFFNSGGVAAPMPKQFTLTLKLGI